LRPAGIRARQAAFGPESRNTGYPPDHDAMATRLMPTARRSPQPTSPPLPAVSVDRLPTLVAPRLHLRWMEARDLEDMYAVFSDPEVMRFWSHTAWPHQDEASIYLEAIQRGFEQGNLFQWGIALRGDDRVIGTVTLYAIDHPQGRAEIGFALAREHWGHRYAHEALTVLFDHAFGTLELRRIEADVDPRNQPSLRTLEALGFRREGYLRQRWQVAGELQDSVVMGLLVSDWQSAR
jgi:RimJ/RimL family protein N-acetyltransferase